MPSRLNLKLAETIRKRAAHILLHELKDPRVGFVTVTRVELAADLVSCVIYWSILGTPGDRSKMAHALADARLFIQRRVAEGLKTRSAPLLTFEFDESVEGAIKMGGLLKQLRVERGDPEPDPAAAASVALPAATSGDDDPEAELEDDIEEAGEDAADDRNETAADGDEASDDDPAGGAAPSR